MALDGFVGSGQVLLRAGTTGTPASIIFLRAEILSPIASIVSGRGPMNTSPASAHRRAKSAFSDRNP